MILFGKNRFVLLYKTLSSEGKVFCKYVQLLLVLNTLLSWVLPSGHQHWKTLLLWKAKVVLIRSVHEHSLQYFFIF